VVVALLTEDNADRISVFNVTRLMPPGSALGSPIVFMFPSESIFVRAVTTCAIDVFTRSDAFLSLKVTRPNFGIRKE
jgi:hypothetical protein